MQSNALAMKGELSKVMGWLRHVNTSWYTYKRKKQHWCWIGVPQSKPVLESYAYTSCYMLNMSSEWVRWLRVIIYKCGVMFKYSQNAANPWINPWASICSVRRCAADGRGCVLPTVIPMKFLIVNHLRRPNHRRLRGACSTNCGVFCGWSGGFGVNLYGKMWEKQGLGHTQAELPTLLRQN